MSAAPDNNSIMLSFDEAVALVGVVELLLRTADDTDVTEFAPSVSSKLRDSHRGGLAPAPFGSRARAADGPAG